MLFDWTDFWIILHVLETILVILDLSVVGVDNPVSVIDQVIQFTALFVIWLEVKAHHAWSVYVVMV